METIFLEVLNRSISAGWLILFVAVLRFVLKDASKNWRTFWWGLVAVRLIVPISIESIFSLIPSKETVSPEILYANSPTINTGVAAVNEVVNPVITKTFAPAAGASVNPLQVVTYVAARVWILGMIALFLYMIISYLRLKKVVAEAVELQDSIWICDHISDPFILGVGKPGIYLPSTLEVTQMQYVIAHEKAHLKRHDNLWKPMGFCLAGIYWFNPLIWLAYYLFCKDMELACDEKAIKGKDLRYRKNYSETLLELSCDRKFVGTCPVAFGETGVKGRIKYVLEYKQPTFLLKVVALISILIGALCFLTNPKAGSLSVAAEEEIYAVELFEKNTVDDAYDEWIIKTYYKMSDGTWMADLSSDGEEKMQTYKYRIVIHGTLPTAAADNNYIILSNRDDITFREAWMASGFSSNLDDYFKEDEAVFVASWLGTLESNHPERDKDTIYVIE